MSDGFGLKNQLQMFCFLNLILCIFKPASPQVIMGKNRKDTPLLDLIKDTLPLIEERKKTWHQVDSNSGPLHYKTIAVTTLPPPLPHLQMLVTDLFVGLAAEVLAEVLFALGRRRLPPAGIRRGRGFLYRLAFRTCSIRVLL